MHTNGSIHIECQTLRRVVSSAAQTETSGVFHNCKVTVVMRNIPAALNHSQSSTPVRTDTFAIIYFAGDAIKKR